MPRHLGKTSLLILCLLFSVTSFSQQTETIYLWESPNGTVNETGGTITQHNSLTISRINYKSSGYYTIQLCGKKENISDEDNTLASVYFTITLSNGATFHQGDNIEITAMRNNDTGGKASIHFLYGTPATASAQSVIVDDTNIWANLGQMHEINISGGTSAKEAALDIQGAGDTPTDAGTEPVEEYSLYPSTNTFTVPAEADGTTAITLTRNYSECMLYITKLLITRVASEKTPLKGDVNGDGKVDINDVNVILGIICGEA